MERIKTMFLNKEFLKFLVVGGVNTCSGVVLALIYNALFNPNISFVLGYLSALIGSYVLNSYITFQQDLRFVKFCKFAVSYMPNFIIQYIVVFFIYNIMGADKLLAYAVAASIGIPVTFVIIRIFTFKG